MPPETRAFVSKYLSDLMDAYQYQYYIPEAILNWIDYSAYQIKFDFFKKPKKIKKETLEIE